MSWVFLAQVVTSKRELDIRRETTVLILPRYVCLLIFRVTVSLLRSVLGKARRYHLLI